MGGVLSLMVAIGIGRFAYTPALPVMRKTFGLTMAAAGTLASSNYLGGLLMAAVWLFGAIGSGKEYVHGNGH
jgi:hypothetical protein